MKKSVGVKDLKNVFIDLEDKKESFFKHHFTKYVVDYKIEDDHIKVISNVGAYRMVKNTKSNITKINRAIVKNKVAIANKIDEYEASSKERLTVLLINIALVGGCGILIPFSFFTGVYAFFLFSLISFSLSVITTCRSGLSYYIIVKEIQNLKAITGYKKEAEFKLPRINVKYSKSRN